MKPHKFALVAAVACLAASQLFASHNSAFTLASLKAEYILTEQGKVGTSTEVNAIGKLTFDSAGGVTGWLTVRAPAINVTAACTGSYTISADGTGTLSLSRVVDGSGLEGETPVTVTSSYKLLAFGSGTAGQDLKAIRSENGQSITAELTRMQAGAVAASLKGQYIFSEEGTAGGTSALAGLGLISFDGQGNVSGRETVQMSHMNLTTTFTGTYALGLDGTGAMTLVHTLPDPVAEGESPRTATAKYRFLVKGDGSGPGELRAIRSENGIVVSTSFKSQSH